MIRPNISNRNDYSEEVYIWNFLVTCSTRLLLQNFKTGFTWLPCVTYNGLEIYKKVKHIWTLLKTFSPFFRTSSFWALIPLIKIKLTFHLCRYLKWGNSSGSTSCKVKQIILNLVSICWAKSYELAQWQCQCIMQFS